MPIFQPGGTNAGYRGPAKTLTIKALQDRQAAMQAAAEASAANAAPIVNAWQGAGALMNQLGDSMQMSRAAGQEADARAQLARLVAGIDPVKGASMEQIAQMQQLDPEFANKEYLRAMEERAAVAAREDEQGFRAGESQIERDARIAEQERTFGQQDKTASTLAGTQEAAAVADDARAAEAATVAAENDRKQAALEAGYRGKTPGEIQAAIEAGIIPPEMGTKLTEAYVSSEQAGAANTARSANDPYSGTGDIVQDYEGGKYGPVGSPEAIQRRDAALSSENLKGTPAAPGSKLRDEWAKVEVKTWGDYQKEGTAAAALSNKMDMLDALGTTPQGPLIGRLATMFPGVSDNAAAFQSIVLAAAPKQREEGSGSTSDLEYDGMLKSLPQLINNPEANRLIAQMVRAQAQISIERAAIVGEWSRSGGNPDADNIARMKLDELNSRSIMDDKLKAMIAAVNGEGEAPVDVGAGGGSDDVDDILNNLPPERP